VPTTALDALGTDRSIVAARINGQIRDLATEVAADDL
jgi:hypothetical protein